MELEKWKKHKQLGNLTEASFRGMFGYKRVSKTMGFAYYYPFDFVAFLNKRFPEAVIKDVFYKTSGEKDYQKEYLYLKMEIEGAKISAEFVFHLFDDQCKLEFTYNLNQRLKWENEYEKSIIMDLFHWMRRFVEENSLNRLSLVSSSVLESFPVRIQNELLTKEGERHKL